MPDKHKCTTFFAHAINNTPTVKDINQSPCSQTIEACRDDRAGQMRTFLHLRVFTSPTRKHFDDTKREDTPPLKTTQS